MRHSKRSYRRVRKKRMAMSQHVSEVLAKEKKEKVFADKKKNAGRVERKYVPQVAGGEGEKEKWWKAVTTTKTNTSKAATSDSDSNGGE